MMVVVSSLENCCLALDASLARPYSAVFVSGYVANEHGSGAGCF
jgi:hypothetical protein